MVSLSKILIPLVVLQYFAQEVFALVNPSNHTTSNLCPKYKCIQDSEQQLNYCALNEWPNLRLRISQCPSGQFCYVNENLDGVCILRDGYHEPYHLYPGQKCGSSGKCAFADGVCNGECQGRGFGESCKWSGDCNYGLYCDKGRCANLIQAGEECYFDEACDRDSLCYYRDPALPFGICTKILSLDDGTQIGYATSEGKMIVPGRAAKLCTSQFVGTNGKCQSTGKSTKVDQACTQDSECTSTIAGVFAKCECTHQEGGERKCGLLPEDGAWVASKNAFIAYIKATRNCHPAAGYTACGAAKEYYDWKCKEIRATYHIQLQNNPSCLQQIYSTYWFFKDYHEFCLSEPKSALTLKIQGVLLIIIGIMTINF